MAKNEEPIIPDHSFIPRILSFIHRFEDSLLALLLLAMIILAAGQIFLRNLFEFGFTWADPLLRILVLWLALLGALAASRENKHITIDVLTRYLNKKWYIITRSITAFFTAVVTAIIAYHATLFVLIEREAESKAFSNLPAWLFEIIIPIAFAIMSLRYLLHTYQYIRDLQAQV
ncbi:MAG: TRAP transporter small permease [Thiohalomonadales bacterium]